MDVTITTRHCTIPDSLHDQAERMLARFERLHMKATSATLSFESDGYEKSAEARLHPGGGPPIVAHGTGPTFRAALDQAVERLDRQVKRRRKRWLQRRTAARGIEPSIL